MTEAASSTPAGWGWPAASRRAHYFEQGSIESVCRAWWYHGSRDPDEGKDGPDDCKVCQRWVQKMRAAAAK